MNWSIDFAPVLPTPYLWAVAAIAVLLVGYLLIKRARGALLRAAALAALIAALANPTLRQEQRESLANVAIVVVDESASQNAGRPAGADRRRSSADLEAKLTKIPNLTVKWVPASLPGDATAPGTNLFADLNKALADTPPDRLAGVILLTDGQVHDVPASAASLGFDAPVHALLTGAPDEFDRRIEILKAPRYGIVGQSRDIEVVVREAGKSDGAPEAVTLKVRREGRPDEHVTTTIGRPVTIDMPFPHAGQNILKSSSILHLGS